MILVNACVPHLHTCMYAFAKKTVFQDANVKSGEIGRGLVVNLQKQR